MAGRTGRAWLPLLTTYGVIVSGAALLAVGEQTSTYALLCVVLCAAHALVVGPSRAAYLSGPGVHLLAIVALAFSVLQANAGYVHLSLAAAHFLMLIQLILLYGLRSRRDLRLIQVAAFFELMVAGIWAVDMAYLPGFGLAALCIMANMMSMTVGVPAPRPSSPAAAAASSAPAVGWRVLVAALWLPVVVVFCGTAAFFVLLPRFHIYGRLPMVPSDPMTGFSENVSLREVGLLRQSNKVAMRVKFLVPGEADGTPTRPPRVLMRGMSLPVYRGGQWLGYSEAIREVVRKAPPAELAQGDDFTSPAVYQLSETGVKTALILQKVTLQDRSAWPLFALYRAKALRGSYESPIDPVSNNVVTPLALYGRQSYDVLSIVPEFSSDRLRQEGTPRRAPPWISHWSLPTSLVPALKRVADEIERAYSPQTDYDRVMAAQGYLTDPERFSYTLELPDYGREDPIVAFLTQTRRGSCEHFSSALALLLRVWGIPTRLVIGFKEGEWDPAAESYVFRDRDAHAWVEVFFNHVGWVEFDPSPRRVARLEAAMGPPGTFSRIAASIRSAFGGIYEDLHASWGRNILDYNRTRQQTTLNKLREAAADLIEAAGWVSRGLWPRMPDLGLLQVASPAVLFTLLAMGVYLAAQRVDAALRRRSARTRTCRTLRFYEDLLSLLSRRGLKRPPNATAREFAQTVAQRLAATGQDGAHLVSAVNYITDVYYRTRFGRYSPTKHDEAELRAALRLLRQGYHPA